MKQHMNQTHFEELEKSAADLLTALAAVLAVGGPDFEPAAREIRLLLKTPPLLNAEKIRAHTRALAGLSRPAGPRRLAMGEIPLPNDISELLISLINHVVSLRPNYYEEVVARLIGQVEIGGQLAAILSGFLDLIIQLRDDMWEERSKAFKHIEEILKTLEATEKDFIDSIDTSQAYLLKSDQDFTSALEDGLMEIGSLVSPGCSSLEVLCQQISDKVGKLHACIQHKKQADKARLASLRAERQTAETRLKQSKRDYDEFLRQSHEMLQEIETLRAVSLHDPLTEVYNRRAYDNQLPKTLTAFKNHSLKTCSLVVFDIDNFREFNNTYGHLAGDRVLAYVARLTRDSLRSDDLIFRYGGDEFVILMPNATIDAALLVAEKVRRNITSVEFKLFKNSDITVQVTISMGVAEINVDDDPASFFARADQAMFHSKTSGRNQVSAAASASDS